MALTPAQLADQEKLKEELQNETGASKLETLAAALLGRLLDLPIAVAKSGFQHGGDAGPAGQQGRRFRLECKKYSDSTKLSDRELLGEIDHALARDVALEAWVLVATRSVPEQLAQDLAQKGERVGVPIIIIDWQGNDLAPLAALCSFDPDLVEANFSKDAGALARALHPIANDAVASLRRSLQNWCLGFASLRSQSHSKLNGVWTSPRTSNAELAQDAAGGAQPKKVRRRSAHDALDTWWQGPAVNDSPAAIVGWDGVGKTWATLDWLTDRAANHPIIVVVPSSALASVTTASEVVVKRFLADRLYELTMVRDPEHWRRRLDYLLKRPASEGPVLTVFFDGMNQEPSVPWLPMLKVLQGDAFAGRLRIIASTRTHHFNDKLSELRGLAVSATRIAINPYDLASGGELDQMLAFDGLSRADLHPDLIELARTPRLFKLVVRFRDRLIEAGQVTIHRLLWEYGRDTFGERAGKSFSEEEWRAWLVEIAKRYRAGLHEYSLKTLGETASRPDLSEREVYLRLSDIIDGQFTKRAPSGALQLTPTVVAHALAAALLAHLDTMGRVDFAAIDAEVTQWFDPIAGLDQRAEILRATVSILIERGGRITTPVAGVLVTAWLQTQNVTDAHRRELAALAQYIPDALLDAVEQSNAYAQASARLWAVNALRAIPRIEGSALDAIVARVRSWLCVVSRDVDNRPDASAEIEKRRADRYKARIGEDASGPRTVLGVALRLVDRDDTKLQASAPSILEGFPLAKAISCFEAMAVASSVRGHADAWGGMKWLCHLNEVDPGPMADALRALSSAVQSRIPEAGIHPGLPGRAAALLLWLTGHEADEEMAGSIDSRIDHHHTYEKDYLANPSRSFFPLERRHADIALSDKECALRFRLERTSELWLDPTFQPPQVFVDELRAAASSFDVEKLGRQMGRTQEEYLFDDLQPVLARCAPDALAELVRRRLQSFASCPPESRYWSALHATDHLLLASGAEATAAQALRLSAKDKDENQEAFAASNLIKIELQNLGDVRSQFDELIAADLKFIMADFAELMRVPIADDVDALLTQYRAGTTKQQHDLLVLLSVHPIPLSDGAWSWLVELARQPTHELRHVLFRMLALADAGRFGRMLDAEGWSWDPQSHFWVNHYGTSALIRAQSALPFDQLAPRLAPWRLLEAARVRGADPIEVRLAAEIFGHALAATKLDEPDPGSTLVVERSQKDFTPLLVSAEPRASPQEQGDPVAKMRAALDPDGRANARMHAFEIAASRIDDARKSGASLYLMEMGSEDLELVLQHASDLLDGWLEGYRERTMDFRRRVRLAEPAFLALCEALLRRDPARGSELWHALNATMATKYVGAAGIDELLHIVFRVPDSTPVATLRREVVSLSRCNSDRDVFNVAVAAAYNGQTAWVAAVAVEDQASPLVWRQRRGLLFAGFDTGNVLPVADAWPEGKVQSNRADLRWKAARFRWSEACAHHWWRAYLAAHDAVEAYAAWILFLRSVDGRAWTWMREDVEAQIARDAFFDQKLAHVQLNRSDLKRAMEKRPERIDRKFLDDDIVDGVGPWGKMSEAN